jgi:outer membrane receptor for Fe3+-dicitrate
MRMGLDMKMCNYITATRTKMSTTNSQHNYNNHRLIDRSIDQNQSTFSDHLSLEFAAGELDHGVRLQLRHPVEIMLERMISDQRCAREYRLGSSMADTSRITTWNRYFDEVSARYQ